MRLRQLRFRYPDRGFELGPLDVEGPDDRAWLILGPSGSGKSTLLRLLAGALRPQTGVIERLDREDEAAYVPQFPERALAGRNLAEDLSGRIRPAQTERRRLRDALREAGLAGVPLSRRSRDLSGGERRLATLALLVLAGFEHWALDEPDAALDEVGLRGLQGLLGRRAPDRRLWIATHRFEVYRPLDPWALVLDDGNLVGCGDLRDLVARPEVAAALSLDARPAFRLWASLGRSVSSVAWTPSPVPAVPDTLPPDGDRETLVRLQVLEKMGI
jgi:energy-coupling factor transporter ATP-binding protein EcfA2